MPIRSRQNQQRHEQQDRESNNSSSTASSHGDDEPCCTCCGCCPKGCSAWWAGLNKLTLLYFVLMFAASILFFAGAATPVFQTTDIDTARRQIWSAWYHCNHTDSSLGGNLTTTQTSATGTVLSRTISFLVSRDYDCVATFASDNYYFCDAPQARLNMLGALHLVCFILSIVALLTSIATLINWCGCPILPFFLTAVVVAVGGAVTYYSRETMWHQDFCPFGTAQSGKTTYPAFDMPLDKDVTLQEGDSWKLLIAATVVSAVSFILIVCVCAMWGVSSKKKANGNDDGDAGAEEEEHDDGNEPHGDDDEDENDNHGVKVVGHDEDGQEFEDDEEMDHRQQ